MNCGAHNDLTEGSDSVGANDGGRSQLSEDIGGDSEVRCGHLLCSENRRESESR